MREKKRIKLFVDAHVFDDPLQGSRTYLKGLYKELIRCSPDITFYFGSYYIENLKSEFGTYENTRYVKYITRNKYIRLTFEIPFIILKNHINISHFQYITPIFRFCEEILTIHDVLFLDFPDLFPPGYRFRNKILFRRSARKADFLLTVSEYSRQRISEHFNIGINKIHVVPNGIADEYFDYSRELPDVKVKYGLDRYILFVSRIEPRKNHILLLKAFTELELWKAGYKLLFIGSRALHSELFENYLDGLPEQIRKSVILIDNSYGNELISFYRNCSLSVYPSLAEGFGIPPLEAAASKVPVLCANTTAMRDFKFLRDGLFNPESVSELKEKIVMSLNDTGK